MFRTVILILTLLASLFAPPQVFATQEVIPTQEESAQESARVNEFFNQVLHQLYLRSPIIQTSYGDRSRYGEWDDFSDSAVVEEMRIWRDSLATLHSDFNCDILDYQTQISYRLFENYARQQQLFFEYRFHRYQIHHLFGLHTDLPDLLTNMHRIESYSDAVAYISRLRGIGDVFDQLITNMETGADLGVILPSFIVPQVIETAQNVITGAPFDDSGENSVLYEDFTNKVNALTTIGAAERDALIADATDALLYYVEPAYESLIAYLRELEAEATDEAGVWRFPDGDDYYRMCLAYRTTTSLSPRKIHKRGLRNVRRIHREMKKLMQQVGFEGDLQDFFEFTRTDKRFYYKNNRRGRQQCLRRVEEIIRNMEGRLDELFLSLPEAELVIRAVEPYREESASLAFYSPPPRDGSGPGVFYINLHDMNNQPIFELEALAYHEGVPGHHLQIATARELEFDTVFRTIVSYTAYAEGWALYCEQIPKEIGFYQDPYSDFGRLSMELWRACRLVVDTGIHFKKWTRQEAIDYLLENTPAPESYCVKEIDRYIVNPAQATAYMIGMSKIFSLRSRAQRRLGGDFDIREFHDVILRNGSLPLGILEEIVEGWIRSKEDS